jgi:glutathione S-transferase
MLKVFVDYVSQPSRAVALFCRAVEIPHEIVITRLALGMTRTTEFALINPTRQVPAIVDGDFPLAESHAIMKYLLRTKVADAATRERWFPSDPKAQARVDAVLDIHHTRVRRGMATWIFGNCMGPLGQLPVPPREVIDWHFSLATRGLKDLQALLVRSRAACEAAGLGHDKAYLASEGSMTIADISVACELSQMEGFPGSIVLLDKVPEVKEWYGRVSRELEPHWTEVHAVLQRVAAAAAKAGIEADLRSSRL